jgi:hypothetical protein
MAVYEQVTHGSVGVCELLARASSLRHAADDESSETGIALGASPYAAQLPPRRAPDYPAV